MIKLTPLGYAAPGAGYEALPNIDKFRGTTNNVCGFWPFSIGASSPMIGVPLGRNQRTGQTVCADPISWFQRGKLISNPSAFVMGRPGLGKSTLIRRWVTGLAYYGVVPMILGDVKPDYVGLIKALGGQVIELGPGRGSLNILDPGNAFKTAEQLPEGERTKIIADAKSKVAATLSGLISVLRGQAPSYREESILTSALDLLYQTHFKEKQEPPVIADLLEIIRQAPPELRAQVIDRGNKNRYEELTEDLEASLQAIMTGSKLGGGVFARQTTENIDLGRPIVFDVSHIGEDQSELKAAILLACWSAGFAAINLYQALAEAGLKPKKNFFVVLDELWSVLRSGPKLVEKVDQLTRLNRTYGVGQALCTHTMKDLDALPDAADQAKALGFVERSGMVVCAGLPRNDMPRLSQVVGLSEKEKQILSSWDTPQSWDAQNTAPPGRGKFLIKVGHRPGIEIDLQLTSVERDVNNTNQKWGLQQ